MINRYLTLIRGLAGAARRRRAALQSFHTADLANLREVMEHARNEYNRAEYSYERCRTMLRDHYNSNVHALGMLKA